MPQGAGGVCEAGHSALRYRTRLCIRKRILSAHQPCTMRAPKPAMTERWGRGNGVEGEVKGARFQAALTTVSPAPGHVLRHPPPTARRTDPPYRDACRPGLTPPRRLPVGRYAGMTPGRCRHKGEVAVSQRRADMRRVRDFTHRWVTGGEWCVRARTLRLLQSREARDRQLIASIHRKDTNQSILNWFGKGLVRYFNKRKADAWVRSVGLYLPEDGSPKHRLLTRILRHSDVFKATSKDQRPQRKSRQSAVHQST